MMARLVIPLTVHWRSCLGIVLAMSSCAFSAELDELDPKAIVAVLQEAEKAGLTIADGAHCFEGEIAGALSKRHLRRTDGTWLIDLVEPAPLKTEAIQTLQALPLFAAGMPEFIRNNQTSQVWRYALIHAARSIQFGDRQLGHELPRMHRESIAFGKLIGYPRIARPEDTLMALRVACCEFIATHKTDAPLEDLISQEWRGQVQSVGAAWHASQTHTTSPVGNLRDLPDSDLILAVGDRSFVQPTTSQEIATRGEVALDELERRWRIDPALLAGRNPQAPWDDREQAAIATALQAWWTSASTQDWSQRLTALATHLSIGQMVTILEISASWDRNTHKSEVSGAAAWSTFSKQMALVLADKLTTGPGDLTAKQFRLLISWFPDHPNLNATLDKLSAPKGTDLSWSLAARHDQRGHPENLDALVEETLQQGPGNDAKAAVWIWATHPTPYRWQRLRDLQAGPETDPSALAIQAAAGYGSSFTPMMQVGLPGNNSPMALGLALLALHDERPLPIALMPSMAQAFQQYPSQPPNEFIPSKSILKSYRLADLALIHVRLNMFNLLSGDFCRPFLGDYSPSWHTAAPLTPATKTDDRNEYRASLITYLTPLVVHELQQAGLAVPDSFTGVKQDNQLSSVVPDVSTQGTLTSAEAAAIDALHARCTACGLPDLAGADFFALRIPPIWIPGGLFPFESESPVLIQYADGKALFNGSTVLPEMPDRHRPHAFMPELKSFNQRLTLMPLPVNAGDPLFQSCAPETAERLRAVGRLDTFSMHPRWAILAALSARWHGADTTGCAVISAAILQASVGNGSPLVLLPTNGLYVSAPRELLIPPIMVSIEREVRLALGRWCVELAATSPDESIRAAGLAAIATLADPRDQTALEAEIHSRTKPQSQIRLPHPGDSTAAVYNHVPVVFNDDRKTYWPGLDVSSTQSLSDDDLIKRLSDDSAVAWRQGNQTRCASDVVLGILAQRWDIDPRWAVIDDRDVRALLPSLPESRRCDDRLWQAVPWTPKLRTAVTSALTVWWQSAHTRSLSIDQRLAPLWQRLPAADWCDYEERRELTTVGAIAVAAMVRQMPTMEPSTRVELLRRCSPVLVTLKSHPSLMAAFQAVEDTPWGRELTALRRFIHHDEGAWDTLMHQALTGKIAPSLATATTTEPLLNLGFYLSRPSPQRFKELKVTLARSPDDPVMQTVLCRVGSIMWPLFGTFDVQRREELIPDEARCNFAFALALHALNDVRPLSTTAIAALPHFRLQSAFDYNPYFTSNDLWPIERNPRVCDWVMTFLICSERAPFDKQLINKILGGDDARPFFEQADRFVRLAQERRDRIIDHLKKSLSEELAHTPSMKELMPLLQTGGGNDESAISR